MTMVHPNFPSTCPRSSEHKELKKRVFARERPARDNNKLSHCPDQQSDLSDWPHSLGQTRKIENTTAKWSFQHFKWGAVNPHTDNSYSFSQFNLLQLREHRQSFNWIQGDNKIWSRATTDKMIHGSRCRIQSVLSNYSGSPAQASCLSSSVANIWAISEQIP